MGRQPCSHSTRKHTQATHIEREQNHYQNTLTPLRFAWALYSRSKEGGSMIRGDSRKNETEGGDLENKAAAIDSTRRGGYGASVQEKKTPGVSEGRSSHLGTSLGFCP